MAEQIEFDRGSIEELRRCLSDVVSTSYHLDDSLKIIQSRSVTLDSQEFSDLLRHVILASQAQTMAIMEIGIHLTKTRWTSS